MKRNISCSKEPGGLVPLMSLELLAYTCMLSTLYHRLQQQQYLCFASSVLINIS